MPDDSANKTAGDAPVSQAGVSPNNPCPFLRAVVAEGFVDGHVVPLARLSQIVEAASGEKGLKKKLAGLKTYLVALIANGLNPCACCAASGPAPSSTPCAMVRWTSTAAARASST